MSSATRRMRDLARGGKEWIARYQAEEIERTGIAESESRLQQVFGYYLECTAAQADKVPADYIRKQTLKNQERFITPQLKEHEEKVLRAEGQAIQTRTGIVRRAAGTKSRSTAPGCGKPPRCWRELDVLVGLATLAVNARYCRPEITTEAVLDIREGRHPVLDRLQAERRIRPERRPHRPDSEAEAHSVSAACNSSPAPTWRARAPTSGRPRCSRFWRRSARSSRRARPRSAWPTGSSPASGPATNWAAGKARSWSR